jgi:hypothetical protein
MRQHFIGAWSFWDTADLEQTGQDDAVVAYPYFKAIY